MSIPTDRPTGAEEVTFQEISDPLVMAKMPLVSVKMLTYNHEPYIAQAIEGVLMQETDFPVELVIGEDCSTDRTREIVLDYQRKRPDLIRVVLWDKNTGGRRNSRKVDELLRGKYIAWCEGDDYWTHPKKLQMQIDIMEADPAIGLVHGGADEYEAASRRRYRWRRRPRGYDDGNIFLKYFYGKYHVRLATVCIRKSLYHAVRKANPDVFGGQFLMGDIPLYWELARITRFRLINKPLAAYRILPESITKSEDPQKLMRFRRSGLELRLHYVRKYGLGPAGEFFSRRKFARTSLINAFLTGDRYLADSAWRQLKSINARIRVQDLVLYWGTKCPLLSPAKAKSIRSLKRVLFGAHG